MLTNDEVILKRIKEGIVPDYAKLLYMQSLLALGIEESARWQECADSLPYFPTTFIKELEVGRSRRMLADIQVMVSRLLSNVPAVEVRHVEEVEGEVIKQYISNRLNGVGGEGGWIEEVRAAGCDGNALGLGAVQIHAEDDDSGYQKVCVNYHHPWYVLFDPYEWNVTRSKWVCFVHHVSLEEAKEIFPDAEEHAFQVGPVEFSSEPMMVCRIYEYFDVSDKKSEPTRALILGDLCGKNLKKEANPYGILPVAVCLGYDNPTQFRPYGRIMNESGLEAMINLIERKMKEVLESRSGHIMDMSNLDETDVQAWVERKTDIIKAKGTIDKNPVVLIPEVEPASHLRENLDYFLRAYNNQSNLSELDRGVPVSKRMTAQEVHALTTQSQANRSIEGQQQALFLKRLFEKVLVIAKLFDRSPMVVELFGTEIEINRPEEPNSAIDKFLQGNYEIFVDAEAITAGEKVYEDAAELAKIRELGPLVGQTISPQEYTKQILKLVGIEDPGKWMQMAAPFQGSTQPAGAQRPEDVAREMIRGNQEAA